MNAVGDLDEWALRVRLLEEGGLLPGASSLHPGDPTATLVGLAVRGFPISHTGNAIEVGHDGSLSMGSLRVLPPSSLDCSVAVYSSAVPVVVVLPTGPQVADRVRLLTATRDHHPQSVQRALSEREASAAELLLDVVNRAALEGVPASCVDGASSFAAVDLMTLHQLLLLPDHAVVSAKNPILGGVPPAEAASNQFYTNPDRSFTAVASLIWELNGEALLGLMLPTLYEEEEAGNAISHSPLSFSGWTTLRLSHRGGGGAPSTPVGPAAGNAAPPSPFYAALVSSSVEANEFGATPTIDRVHYSYLCALSLLGWRLHSEETGELDRHRGWRERYAHWGRAPSLGLPMDAALLATARFLLSMRLVSFSRRLVEFMVEEAKAGRLTHAVLPEDGVLRAVLLPMVSGAVFMDTPVMEEGDVGRLLKTIQRLVDKASDSE